MTAFTATDFNLTIGDTTITAAALETFIDDAIDQLNLYNPDLALPNMTGVAGTKTVDLTSRQRGAIKLVATEIYRSVPKGTSGSGSSGSSSSAGVGPISWSESNSSSNSSSVMTNPSVLNAVKEAASLLGTRRFLRA
jgi:hypothetical protein